MCHTSGLCPLMWSSKKKEVDSETKGAVFIPLHNVCLQVKYPFS